MLHLSGKFVEIHGFLPVKYGASPDNSSPVAATEQYALIYPLAAYTPGPRGRQRAPLIQYLVGR